MAPKKAQKEPARSHRSTLSLQKTEIYINVYDLLPAGRLSAVLWAVGASLLHSGVVINGREYAYGGHDRRGVTGVYWTRPRTEPPGGTFRVEILHGMTFSTADEIDGAVRDASDLFQGTAYNLLTRNCNHFTAHLCERLTGRPGPAWLNRAAAIGVALPCVVPRDWIEPPDYDNTDGGELLDGDDDDEDDFGDGRHERSRMLRPLHDEGRGTLLIDDGRGSGLSAAATASHHDDADSDSDDGAPRGGASGKGKGKAPVRDTSGRALPPAERAPI